MRGMAAPIFDPPGPPAPATRGGTFLALVAWQVVSFSAAVVGSQFMPGAWYASLAKPSWTPPNWVFGPAWTLLYTLMGIAAWLIWRRAGWRSGARALGLFIVQLVLNALWSYVVFGLHLLAAGVFEMALLWIAILATLVAFWRVSVAAGVLFLPYLAWVSFAFFLNVALWRMNP
jgi:tryptophan-rich sensory protein